jgi:hypothetical protein
MDIFIDSKRCAKKILVAAWRGCGCQSLSQSGMASSGSLNPHAQEFVPIAVQQRYRDFPSLQTRPTNRKKNPSLNFSKAVKHQPKEILTPSDPPFPVDPSWLVLTEKEIKAQISPLPIKDVDNSQSSPLSKMQPTLIYEKPSIGAIDRWKVKWMEVARIARQKLQFQRVIATETRPQEIKTEGSWHNILSPSIHLDRMAVAPIPLPQPSISFFERNQIVIPPSHHSIDTSHCLQTLDDWWLAIQNGEVSKLASAMSRNSDWKSFSLRVPPPSKPDLNQTKEIKMGLLHTAVYFRQSQCIQLFLDAGHNFPSSSL